ncbi:hypothetical protein ASD11_07875 [Aeromicrobium sp. Root495]|uniref:DUF429 domain-containing protein n=1 Tax=Aeromicrobium sp. Root495 TaxID=1736550 RepID=UPI0006F6900D|nr:DUF429 domain-containing protein [Aeromicrobium sp. Root495]KQY59470.1 hypothetical protein ASD11_07875 [Aeromicrobium sp. Root495]
MSHIHVGIDLAWSRTHRSGLAAVDRDGRVLDSATALDDDEILAWIDDVGEPLVLGIDAPVVVRNASGMRQGERELSRVFSRFGAGPYPTSRAFPLFDPPRAEELAEQAGWSTDADRAATASRPLAVEVYPHPALVSWFELPRRLAYKRGPDRRAELDRLCGLLEQREALRLPDHPRWPTLRSVVRDGRGAALKAAEDEVDAIVCAHLAWTWHERPGELVLYGDPAEGAIVAPRAPVHRPGGWTS